MEDINNGWRCNGALGWRNAVMLPSKFPTGAQVIFGGLGGGGGLQGVSGTKSPEKYSAKK